MTSSDSLLYVIYFRDSQNCSRINLRWSQRRAPRLLASVFLLVLRAVLFLGLLMAFFEGNAILSLCSVKRYLSRCRAEAGRAVCQIVEELSQMRGGAVGAAGCQRRQLCGCAGQQPLRGGCAVDRTGA